MRETADTINVLMVATRSFPYIGGLETHVYEVGRRLATRDDIRVTLLTTVPYPTQNPAQTQLPNDEFVDGIHIIRVPAWPAQRDYAVTPEIYSIIKGGKWDLIHCQGCHTLIPPLAMLAARSAHIPYVVTFHTGGHTSPMRNRIRPLQWRFLAPLLANAQKLIAVSRYESDYFRNLLHLPEQQLAVIPNGANLPVLPDVQPNLATHQPLIISVGRLERYKGHHLLIMALPKIRERLPDARLLILGAGPYELALRKLAEEFAVAQYVEIRTVPAEDRAAMAAILAQASLVALLSEYESQGIAVVEALALGRPVLVANTPSFREFVEQQSVRAVELDASLEEIAAATLLQIKDPLIPKEIALPTWENCAQSIRQIYKQAVGRMRCEF